MALTTDAIQYAKDVTEGNILANKYVRLQCQTFLNDLNTTQYEDDFRWQFSEGLSDHALGYMQLFKYVEGTVAGQQVELSPWQAFLVANAYGWVDKVNDGIRRYTRLISLVGRKNAKSTVLALVGLYELRFGPEGSQLVTMATQKEQAKLVWNMSGRMAETSDQRLIPSYNRTVSTISNKDNWTRYWPLSKESKRLDGLNIRLAIIDEAAAIKDENLFDVVTSSMGSQLSPQTWMITTGQTGAESNPFMKTLNYGKQVLDGTIDDQRIFTLAYALEEGDEWNDASKWIKSNPNLGISVSLEFLTEEKNAAENIPSKAINFKVKYCNQFLSTAEAWMDVSLWNACALPRMSTEGLPLYIGMDLGATSDLTALTLLWAKEGQYYLDYQAWVPEAAFKAAPNHVRSIYDVAAESGKLVVTEGNVSDHDAVYDYLLDLVEREQVKEVAFDSWSATHLTSRLTDAGLPMVRYDQSMKAMSPASKEAEIIIRNRAIGHLGDPFFAWCFNNCEVYTDANENIKVRKGGDNALKIDPVIAMIMAIGRASLVQEKPKSFSFYID
jgi:phage terminase large subunit-like protein